MEIVSYCSSRGVTRFACAKAGCADCMEALLHENKGLVWVMVTKQFPGNADYADLLQEGRIGLWRAIERYEPDRGVTFGSYASLVIQHQVWRAVKHSQKMEGWLEANYVWDSLVALLSSWQGEQIHQALEEELGVLPALWRQVIEFHYGWSGGAPQTFSEIGDEFGVSRSRASQLHQQALKILRLPGISIHLRTICERQERRHYRQALLQNRGKRGRR